MVQHAGVTDNGVLFLYTVQGVILEQRFLSYNLSNRPDPENSDKTILARW